MQHCWGGGRTRRMLLWSFANTLVLAAFLTLVLLLKSDVSRTSGHLGDDFARLLSVPKHSNHSTDNELFYQPRLPAGMPPQAGTTDDAESRPNCFGRLTSDYPCRLGNHLFQYAAVLSLARRYGMRPFVPARFWHNHSTPTVGKKPQRDTPRVPQSRDDVRLMLTTFPRTAAALANATVDWTYAWVGVYNRTTFDRLRRSCNQTVSLGANYLVDWRLFKDDLTLIRRQLRFDDDLVIRATGYLDELRRDTALPKNASSVCVHTRRTDYTKRKTREGGFMASNELFIHRVLRRFGASTRGSKHPDKARHLFLLFCDDAAWCRQIAHWYHDVFVSAPSTTDTTPYSKVDDLVRLSLCETVILTSASTFGWWGAFLQPDADNSATLRSTKRVYYDANNLAVRGSWLHWYMRGQGFMLPEWTAINRL